MPADKKGPSTFELEQNGREASSGEHADRSYHETPEFVDVHAAEALIRSRRSIRSFTGKAIPEDVVRTCLQWALLAPNSSNLQAWEFYWVRKPHLRKGLVDACLNQQAARTAKELIVCVARPDLYRRNSRLVLDQLVQRQVHSRRMLDYYKKLVPMLYGVGPLSSLGFIKWIAFSLIGLFRPIMRGPYTKKDRAAWAIKTTALACQNLMLAFRAHGFDSCPMEGFDERRVRRLLDLPSGANVVMVVAAGERAVGGVYGPQLRLPDELFVFER